MAQFANGWNPGDFLEDHDIKTLEGMANGGYLPEDGFSSPDAAVEFLSFLSSETWSEVKGIVGTNTESFQALGEAFESGGTANQLAQKIDEYFQSGDYSSRAEAVVDAFDNFTGWTPWDDDEV